MPRDASRRGRSRAAIARARLRRFAGSEFRRRGRGEYVHGDGRRGPAGAPGDSRHPPRKSVGADCGDRLLCAARAGRNSGPRRRFLGGGKFAQAGNSALDRGDENVHAGKRFAGIYSGIGDSRPIVFARSRPGKNPHWEHTGTAGTAGRAGPRRRVGAHAPGAEDSGRLRQAVLVLRNPARARAQPQPRAGPAWSRKSASCATAARAKWC